jgi:hypothetical protein
MQDSRLTDLRDLIKLAVQNNTQLDKNFWLRTFRDLYKLQGKVERSRKRVALVTSPLLFHHLPGHLAREAITEAAGTLARQSNGAHFRWLVMLIDNE